MALAPHISVIIPTWNEESSIGATLKSLGAPSGKKQAQRAVEGEAPVASPLEGATRAPTIQHDVIVVDAGSRDRTCAIARRSAGVSLVTAERRGRAVQMNEGAGRARGDIFFFLHADSVVPQEWASLIHSTLQHRQVAGGAFSFGIDGTGIGYRILEWGVYLRNRLLRLPYGDQGLFVRRDLFHILGGFQEIPIMEDVDFVKRLKRRGELAVLPQQMVTSCRRFERNGLMLQMLKNWSALSLFALGIPPQWLHYFYQRRAEDHAQGPVTLDDSRTGPRRGAGMKRSAHWLSCMLVLLIALGSSRPAAAKKQAQRAVEGEAPVASPLEGATRAPTIDQSHALWGDVLRHYVSQGHVDYAGLKKNPGSLNKYLDAVAQVTEDDFSNYSVNERKALLINLYNASAIALVLKHYPVSSIKELGVKFIGPWKVRYISLWGKKLSLDEIEHGILRKKLFDPRIHFALVCASKGCPRLFPVPFSGAVLDDQLDDAAERFMNDASINHLDPASHTLYLSELFRWFADDFNRAYGSVWNTARRYMTAAAAYPAAGASFKIAYTTYDWSLND